MGALVLAACAAKVISTDLPVDLRPGAVTVLDRGYISHMGVPGFNSDRTGASRSATSRTARTRSSSR